MIRANDENQKYIQDFLNEEKNSFQLFSSKNGVNESNIPDIQGPNEENENDNIFDKSYLGSSLKHSYTSFNLFEFPNSNSGKTELNSIIVLSKRKRLRDKVTNEDKENSEDKIYKNNANIKKMGRRLKDKKYENEANHNKNSDDNIIIKLKTAIFKYILNLLNQSLEFTKYKFYPLNVKLSTCLKKEFNMELLERTIYDIYNTEDLNKTYINGNDSNKKLIKIEINKNSQIKEYNKNHIHNGNIINNTINPTFSIDNNKVVYNQNTNYSKKISIEGIYYAHKKNLQEINLFIIIIHIIYNF